MVFVGIDHGTSSVRFATDGGACFELQRSDVVGMSGEEILGAMESGLDVSRDDVQLMALNYSMGDAITEITPIDDVEGRGLRELGGAGMRVGGGTRVYDVMRTSVMPVMVLPGIHRETPCIDPRMGFFSHGASGEKIGAAYHAYTKHDVDSFVLSDVSSNTVTLAVKDGIIVGALDACIFAPGWAQGPLDLQMIRDVDARLMNANEAFSMGGVRRMIESKEDPEIALETLALLVSMEIRGMQLLSGDVGGSVFLAGELSEREDLKQSIDDELKLNTVSLGRWAAAMGCAYVARDTHNGEISILGIHVAGLPADFERDK